MLWLRFACHLWKRLLILEFPVITEALATPTAEEFVRLRVGSENMLIQALSEV